MESYLTGRDEVDWKDETGEELYEDFDLPPEPLVARLAKAGLINGFGMSMEYMITHVGIIVANPLLYRTLTNFTENYLLSPLGLIGRAAIWTGRGLLAVAVPGERPKSFERVMKKGGIDLLALAAVSVLYRAGSKLAGHPDLLIEQTLVDTAVVSAASLLLESAIERAPSIKWQFWLMGRGERINVGYDDRRTNERSGYGYS